MQIQNVFEGKKVLITGGLGFIGSNLACRLVGMGATVSIIDSLIPEYGGNLFNVRDIADQIRINISDVRDPYSMRYLVQDQDFLFNLAGQTSHMDSMEDPFTDLQINSHAQLSILESCRRHNPGIRIVFASTRQIYGRPESLPVDESHRLAPADVNGVNKVAGEQYHILYNRVYGLPCTALRLTNTYGPRMRIQDARQTFVGLWIRRLIEKKPFDVWGGEQLRDFTYVDDAVDAFLMAAVNRKAEGQVFNLGGERPVSLKELAEILTSNSDTEYHVLPFPEDRRTIDIGDYYADDTLIRKTLGWEPAVPLEDGLKRTVAFFEKHLKHYV